MIQQAKTTFEGFNAEAILVIGWSSVWVLTPDPDSQNAIRLTEPSHPDLAGTAESLKWDGWKPYETHARVIKISRAEADRIMQVGNRAGASLDLMLSDSLKLGEKTKRYYYVGNPAIDYLDRVAEHCDSGPVRFCRRLVAGPAMGGEEPYGTYHRNALAQFAITPRMREAAL